MLPNPIHKDIGAGGALDTVHNTAMLPMQFSGTVYPIHKDIGAGGTLDLIVLHVMLLI